MLAPENGIRMIYGKMKREWKWAFLTCFLLGLVVHMPIMLSDIPNHDGLDSIYFDQNMITSGRWFLMAACGASSFYTLPWVIGLLGLLFLSCTAAALCELLEIRKIWAAALAGGLLVSFPALASTFAYVFTLDGYMLAMLLAVLAVLFTKKFRYGYVPGAVCLSFSMGVYQAYLSFAMILSIFCVVMLFAGEGMCHIPLEGSKAPSVNDGKGRIKGVKNAICQSLHYLYMGVLGAVLYVVLLQILLRLQGKVLADYQGIDGMLSGGGKGGILSAVVKMYQDFFAFTIKGNILIQNVFSLTACVLLGMAALAAGILLLRHRKYWKNPVGLVIIILAILALPAVTNVILLISPSVTYHLLMRYQWVLYLIGIVALIAGNEFGRMGVWLEWAVCLSGIVLLFCFGITDNIAYSNLEKRYEKTYAYCVRLLDRIEQTEGYYPGIPIAMVGVVGDAQYPNTDVTLPVTSNMIGMNGDVLLYRGDNYEAFIRNYLGATLNILPPEAMEQMYFSQEYIEMDSFPGADSIRIMDGIMYVKTENTGR